MHSRIDAKTMKQVHCFEKRYHRGNQFFWVFLCMLVRGTWDSLLYPQLTQRSWLTASLISFRNTRIHVAAFVRNLAKKATCWEHFVYRHGLH